MSIDDDAIPYMAAGTPNIIGTEDYGIGSSRDWRAKGTDLPGFEAVPL